MLYFNTNMGATLTEALDRGNLTLTRRWHAPSLNFDFADGRGGAVKDGTMRTRGRLPEVGGSCSPVGGQRLSLL